MEAKDEDLGLVLVGLSEYD